MFDDIPNYFFWHSSTVVFFIEPKTDTPGPGSYTNSETTSLSLSASPSHSRKGYGPIASSAARALKKLNSENTPGAGTYYPTHPGERRCDFSQGPSATFQSPIAEAVSTKEAAQPAPNAYDVSKSTRFVFRQNNVCADHAFKAPIAKRTNSAAELGGYSFGTGPKVAPNSYFVNDDLLHSGVRVPFSSFKSNTRRDAAFFNNSSAPA